MAFPQKLKDIGKTVGKGLGLTAGAYLAGETAEYLVNDPSIGPLVDMAKNVVVAKLGMNSVRELNRDHLGDNVHLENILEAPIVAGTFLELADDVRNYQAAIDLFDGPGQAVQYGLDRALDQVDHYGPGKVITALSAIYALLRR